MAVLVRNLSRLLTYDFCPWANSWVYWVKRPIASLSLAALAALACAIFVKPLALVSFGALVLVVILGYLWPTIAVRGLSCTVKFDQRRVTEGEKACVLVAITNRWPWSVWGISIEGGFGARRLLSGNEDQESVALARVPGWSTSEFQWEFRPDCRGEYPSTPPRIVTGFPFGLRKASRPVRVEQQLLVWPLLVPLETLLDAAETRPSDDHFSDHRVGESGDMTGTRTFRDGDSLRRVHWAQTARMGRMIVCERQAASQSAIRVVFDSDPHVHRGSGSSGTLEWSIRIAASICAAYHRANANVECCFGHEILPVKPGSNGMKSFLDRLAQWKVCDHAHSTEKTSPEQVTHHDDESIDPSQDHHSQDQCEHEHTSHQCHRIHHRNCGVFQLTVTTDLGLQHRTEHRHVHGDQRLIVLKSDAFSEACTICGGEHHPPNRLSIVLDRPSDMVTDFSRKWRQVCHAG